MKTYPLTCSLKTINYSSIHKAILTPTWTLKPSSDTQVCPTFSLPSCNYMYNFMHVLHQFHFLWKCLLPFANKRVFNWSQILTPWLQGFNVSIKDNCNVLLLNSSNFDESTMTGGSLYLDQLIHNSFNCHIKLGIPDDGPIIVWISLYIEISG